MVEIVQGSESWKKLRLGKLTASRVADATDLLKSGKPSAKRLTYLGELIAERLTGLVVEKYQNELMRWGTEQEPQARALYEFYCGVDVEQVAFVEHPTIAMAGASPDGLVGDDGLIEIKCPSTSTHVDTLLAQAIPEEYVKQIDWQMACTGRLWCDFVSYDPRLPPHMAMFVCRRERDEAAISDLEADARAFLVEIDMKVDALNALYAQEAAA
ncbi:MAG: exonuclease [Methylobacterium sp.]|nr:exonuclease [Methylobacterium sp.]